MNILPARKTRSRHNLWSSVLLGLFFMGGCFSTPRCDNIDFSNCETDNDCAANQICGLDPYHVCQDAHVCESNSDCASAEVCIKRGPSVYWDSIERLTCEPNPILDAGPDGDGGNGGGGGGGSGGGSGSGGGAGAGGMGGGG